MTTRNVKEFVYFTFGEIKTQLNKKGEEKKNTNDLLPTGWQNITLETVNKYNNRGESVGILTGKINNLTVIDYDNKNKFNEDNEKFNFFKNGYHIVETNNGYHLYCRYDENIPQTTNDELHIDIRNDGGFVIAPPTKYKLLNGNEVEYKIINNTDIRQIDNNYYQYLMENGYVKNKVIEPKKEEPAIEGFGIINNKKANNKMDKDFKMNVYLEEILNCLSMSRCDNYNDWFHIACIIKNEGYSSSVFHNFSARSSKYDAEECEKQWNKCDGGGLNIGTLIRYAQHDNKDMYEKLKNEKFEEYKKNKKVNEDKKEKNKNSYNEWIDLLSCKRLADRFMKEWNDFIIISNEQLYVYSNERWYNETDDKKKYKLKLYISVDLHNLLEKEILENENLEKKEKDKLIQTLRNMTSKTGTFNDIINQIMPLVEQKYNIFDNNPFLLGFNNGVYDLMDGEFRSYEYSDYITLSTGYDYEYIDVEDNKNKELFEELVLFFESIQPNKEQLEYFLKVLASGLDGIGYEKLYLYEGRGGNGKGVCSDLMKEILGNYYCQPNNGIIKEMEKANSASPDMLVLMNKRYINFAEVKGLVSLSMLRKLTGGNSFKARALHCNLIDFKMTATFCMEFNNSPDLDGKPTDADYRRLNHVSFPVNFTTDENKIGKTIGNIQYKKAEAKYKTSVWVQKMRNVFLDMLLGVYRQYKDVKDKTGLIITTPDFIQKESEKWVNSQNLFQIVFNTNYQVVDVNMEDKEDIKSKTIKTKDLWKNFSDSAEYRGLKTRRDKAEYGRDEYYEWLKCNFNVIEHVKGNTIIGITEKYIDEDNEDLSKY